MIQVQFLRKPHYFLHFHIGRIVVLLELGLTKQQRQFVSGSVAVMPGPVHWRNRKD